MPASANPPVLRVQDLSKQYLLYASPGDRLKAMLTGRANHQSHWALQGVSFELQRGQCLGVVGNNGAGKSSLLKLLAGTLHPTSGTLERTGRVTAILELGAGFHPDFTGRENIVFGGQLIGIEESQMHRLIPGIIEFSGLADAIDRPIKTYSSGMVVRLAFALVTAVEPDVLIIDEALAVGDQNFQKKCVERIDQFRRNGCTILFCSHSLYHVRQLCDVTLWLDGGRVRAHGDTESVLASYEAFVRACETVPPPTATPAVDDGADAQAAPPAQEGKHAEIQSVTIENLEPGEPPQLASPDLVVRVTARLPPGEAPSIGVMLEQLHGVGVTSVATHADGATPVRQDDGTWAATVTFPDLPLHSGEYVVSAYLFDAQGLVVYDQWMHCAPFKFVYPSLTPGLVRIPHHWA